MLPQSPSGSDPLVAGPYDNTLRRKKDPNVSESLQLSERLRLVTARIKSCQPQVEALLIDPWIKPERPADGSLALLRLAGVQQTGAIIVPKLRRFLHKQRFLQRLQNAASFPITATAKKKLGGSSRGSPLLGLKRPAPDAEPRCGC